MKLPHRGCFVFEVTGPDVPTRRVRVSHAGRCDTLFRYELSSDGHDTDELVGLAYHALECGYTDYQLVEAVGTRDPDEEESPDEPDVVDDDPPPQGRNKASGRYEADAADDADYFEGMLLERGEPS